MAEHIERRALWKRIAYIQERRERDGQLLLAKALDIVIRLVESAPAADVAPVVHAHWVDDRDGIDIAFGECDPDCHCSACGNRSDRYFKYCPQCGAKMDQEAENG